MDAWPVVTRGLRAAAERSEAGGGVPVTVFVTGRPGGMVRVRGGNVVGAWTTGTPLALPRPGRDGGSGTLGRAELADALFAIAAGRVAAVHEEDGAVGRLTGEVALEPVLREVDRRLLRLERDGRILRPEEDRFRLTARARTDRPRLTEQEQAVLRWAEGMHSLRELAFLADRGVFAVVRDVVELLDADLLEFVPDLFEPSLDLTRATPVVPPTAPRVTAPDGTGSGTADGAGTRDSADALDPAGSRDSARALDRAGSSDSSVAPPVARDPASSFLTGSASSFRPGAASPSAASPSAASPSAAPEPVDSPAAKPVDPAAAKAVDSPAVKPVVTRAAKAEDASTPEPVGTPVPKAVTSPTAPRTPGTTATPSSPVPPSPVPRTPPRGTGGASEHQRSEQQRSGQQGPAPRQAAPRPGGTTQPGSRPFPAQQAGAQQPSAQQPSAQQPSAQQAGARPVRPQPAALPATARMPESPRPAAQRPEPDAPQPSSRPTDSRSTGSRTPDSRRTDSRPTDLRTPDSRQPEPPDAESGAERGLPRRTPRTPPPPPPWTVDVESQAPPPPPVAARARAQQASVRPVPAATTPVAEPPAEADPEDVRGRRRMRVPWAARFTRG